MFTPCISTRPIRTSQIDPNFNYFFELTSIRHIHADLAFLSVLLIAFRGNFSLFSLFPSSSVFTSLALLSSDMFDCAQSFFHFSITTSDIFLYAHCHYRRPELPRSSTMADFQNNIHILVLILTHIIFHIIALISLRVGINPTYVSEAKSST